jgi:predicted tellurium resistance membrane protein TerC
MNTFIFIVLILVVIVMRSFVAAIIKLGKEEESLSILLIALLFVIGFSFIYPVILGGMLTFLFGVTYSYWKLYAILVVVNIFTEDLSTRKDDD